MSKIVDLLKKVAKTNKQGGICSGEKYVEKLLEKIKYVETNKFKDELLWLNHIEEKLLGIALSTPKIESYNTSEVTHTCADFINGNRAEKMVFGLDIKEVREYTTKSGDNAGKRRADIIGIDKTGKIKIKVWSTEYEPNMSIIVSNNSVILTGKPGFSKYEDWVFATKIKQAT